MTIKIDPKSVVIGAIATAVVFMAMGFASTDQDAPESERFEVEVNEVYAVIVDTATGQAWRHHIGGGGGGELCPPQLKPTGD